MRVGASVVQYLIAPKRLHVALLALLAFTASLSSTIAWKVSDIDFATKIGSDRLAEAYVFIALVIFGSSSLILSGLKTLAPQSVFLAVQRYAGIAFGLLAFMEAMFSLSSYTSMIFVLKVLGYAYSALVINSFWIALDPYNEKSPMTTGQCTLYTFCTYFGMSMAGFWLQSDTIRAGQLGLLVMCLSIVCWIIGSIAFEARQPFLVKASFPIQADALPRPSPSQTLLRAMVGSRAVMTLVLGSILLNVLVSSTEYYFLADFDSRFLTLQDGPIAAPNIGSFVTLIGLGNILTLMTSRLWSRFHLGRAALPVAALLAVLMMRIGFTDSQSLISSVITLLVVESVYPLVVESNMQYLLARFSESEQLSARTMIDTIAEPTGLLLSALLLIIPGFDIHALGIGVVCVALLLVLFSCSADAVWRRAQLASFRQMVTGVAGRCSTYLVLCQTLLPCIDPPCELTDDLLDVEGYNWLYIPAVQWCD